jgi:CRISPR/Cas system-associated endonuclease Cas1
MIGIMHYDRDGAPAFVFDMKEPERPKVNRAVLSFLKSEALHPADFTIKEDGVVRLNPEMARRWSFEYLHVATSRSRFYPMRSFATAGHTR